MTPKDAFKTYLRILEKNGREIPPTNADIDHSALLERLLSGKQPLDKPPPRSFSCPWYELYDDCSKDDPIKIYEFMVHDNFICINQDPRWFWVNEKENTIGHQNGDVFQLTACESNDKNNKFTIHKIES